MLNHSCQNSTNHTYAALSFGKLLYAGHYYCQAAAALKKMPSGILQTWQNGKIIKTEQAHEIE